MCRRSRDGNPCLKDQLEEPKTRWEDGVLEDIKSMNIRNWKKVVEQARTLDSL